MSDPPHLHVVHEQDDLTASAMRGMSRAIRLEIEKRSTDGRLSGLSDDVLTWYRTIVGAFYADLSDEYKRRELPTKGT